MEAFRAWASQSLPHFSIRTIYRWSTLRSKLSSIRIPLLPDDEDGSSRFARRLELVRADAGGDSDWWKSDVSEVCHHLLGFKSSEKVFRI